MRCAAQPSIECAPAAAGCVCARALTPLNNTTTTNSDKTVLVWHLERSESNYGYAKRALTGHSHFVQDVVISSDGQFALSGSWDGTLDAQASASGRPESLLSRA